MRRYGWILIGWLVVSVMFAGDRAVLYLYRGAPVRGMTGAETFMIDLYSSNVILLTRKYDIVTPETIGEYLTRIGVSNTSTNIPLEEVRKNATNWYISDIVEIAFSPAPRDRTFQINLKIWNGLQNAYIRDEKLIGKRGADIFEALDQMSLILAESLTGKRLGFGSLRVSTTLKKPVIVVDGVEYETSSVSMDNALAGLKHVVMIGYRQKEKLIALYTNEFEIRDGFTYDLTYQHEEYVEVIDLRTNTNRMPREAYRPQTQTPAKLQIGGFLRTGHLNLIWLGGYISYRRLVGEVSVGYTPRLRSTNADDYTVSLHTVGIQALVHYHLFAPEESVWNTGVWVALTELGGVWPVFTLYHGAWPVVSLGASLSLRWGFSWVPSWLRRLDMEVLGGTVVLARSVDERSDAYSVDLYPVVGIALRY